jgi:ABC-type nitrate/sulfonate/bicarbonate transport system ATPase subunit
VEENIAFGLRACRRYKEKKYRISRLIKMMGLQGFEQSYPSQISGGMASRAALARTFALSPGLICLDEPLSALDAFTRATLQDEILTMQKAASVSMILVTHDIEEAVYLCDRVIVMTARPGTNKAELSIDLPRPRDRVSSQFVEYRKQLLSMLNCFN